jgi:DNA polymerase III subunit gamma/tau
VSSGPSLYRRHRPRTFDDVVGQEHVVRTLRNAVKQGKVHHAYLFVGSRGTGKTSMAKILAACLNCVEGPTTEPCGVCESCVSIASATSLDVIEMDAASNNSVDDIRDLRERVAFAPVSGRHKVYILDEAHMLSPQAWNAFLKTLEEPPPNTIFVLATTEANKVLPTVVDRCHRFDFARPAVEDIAGVVGRVAAVEEIEIAPEAIGLLARHATGSFRDALGTLEQLVTYSGTNVATEDVLAVLGIADSDLIFAALDAVAAGDAREALLSVHRVAESGRDPSSYARDLETHARELLVVQTLDEVPPQISMTPDHDARLAEQAERVPREAVVRLLDLLAGALKAVRDGADARTQLELALVKAASPEVDAGTRALLARIERLEQAVSGGGAPPRPQSSQDEPTATVTATVTTTDDRATVTATETLSGPVEGVGTLVADLEHDLEGLLAVWPAVLESLRAENMVLATALSSGRPVELDGRELVVAFGEDDAFKRRKAESEARAIGEAVRTVAGAPVRLRFEVRDLRDEPAEAAPPNEDELVARFVSEFDAEEIQPGEEPEA